VETNENRGKNPALLARGFLQASVGDNNQYLTARHYFSGGFSLTSPAIVTIIFQLLERVGICFKLCL
jgi:hypothetical protein